MTAHSFNRSCSASLDQLTEREREIISHVAQNKTSKIIAAELGIHENTVNKSIGQVREKWMTRDRYETARLFTALQEGVRIHPPQILTPDNQAERPPLPLSNLPETAVFEFADVLAVGRPPLFEDPGPVGLKALDARFGKAWRILAIPVGAILIGMVLCWALLFANGITELLN